MNISEKLLLKSPKMQKFYRNRINILQKINHPLDLVLLEDMFLTTEPYWIIKNYTSANGFFAFKNYYIKDNLLFSVTDADILFLNDYTVTPINDVDSLPTDFESIRLELGNNDSGIWIYTHNDYSDNKNVFGLASRKQFMKEDLDILRNIQYNYGDFS